MQIYSPSGSRVSPYWKEKYERDAKKYWDIFYKRHQDKFFKDRHYLDKEWGDYFNANDKIVILEVGCGAGNTVFPLLEVYQNIFIHACDFSPRAVDLVKAHKDFRDDRINAFSCDLTVENLDASILPCSVDIVIMVFVLSAICPEKMPSVLQNVRRVLKPNGHLLFRDYAVGDLAQERLHSKEQEISENFYVRGDGTRAFYFSEYFLNDLFKSNGFDLEKVGVCCKQVENRARELVMNRRWIQAVFCNSSELASLHNSKSAYEMKSNGENVLHEKEKIDCGTPFPGTNTEVDVSESIAMDMFGLSDFTDEFLEVDIRDHKFKINVLPKEYQHTCKSTGLMLWESARIMSMILAENPSIVSGKTVLELGCGSAGICSMLVAAGSASLVVATDGDSRALDLLHGNLKLNLQPEVLKKIIVKQLLWGDVQHIESVLQLNPEGFDLILGTDVAYVPEAIVPLFKTARALISSRRSEEPKAALVLCHFVRRVDEESIFAAASMFDFRLIDKWSTGVDEHSPAGIIGTWMSNNELHFDCCLSQDNSSVNILYFQLQMYKR